MGTQYPEGRSRSTRDKSPVRESRTPGSARGAGSNPRPYRDPRSRHIHGSQRAAGTWSAENARRRCCPGTPPTWALAEVQRAAGAHVFLKMGHYRATPRKGFARLSLSILRAARQARLQISPLQPLVSSERRPSASNPPTTIPHRPRIFPPPAPSLNETPRGSGPGRCIFNTHEPWIRPSTSQSSRLRLACP